MRGTCDRSRRSAARVRVKEGPEPPGAASVAEASRLMGFIQICTIDRGVLNRISPERGLNAHICI
jgi:hypothetical protein